MKKHRGMLWSVTTAIAALMAGGAFGYHVERTGSRHAMVESIIYRVPTRHWENPTMRKLCRETKLIQCKYKT